MSLIEFATLVYQAGLANVFHVDNTGGPKLRNARLLLQSDFHTCQTYAKGLGAAGVTVRTSWCNKAGNIINLPWTDAREDAPFSDETLEINLN